MFASFCLAGCASDFDSSPNGPQPVARAEQRATPLLRATWYSVAVRHGDTLARVAARYNISVQSVADANKFDVHDRIYAGEMLRIPAVSAQTRNAVLREAVNAPSRNAVYPLPLPPKSNVIHVTRLAPPKYKPRAFSLAQSLSPPQEETVSAAPPPSSPDAASVDAIIAQYASAVKDVASEADARHSDLAAYSPQSSSPEDAPLHFIWPLSGHILSPFGASPGGQRNDGINIAATPGAPIRAAAGGVVTYAGNGIRGYGNLLLIRHDDGFVTAYAHAESLSVSRGERVRKGQEIGRAGATGDVSEPQLHFEIRRGVKAVDPRPLLLAAR